MRWRRAAPFVLACLVAGVGLGVYIEDESDTAPFVADTSESVFDTVPSTESTSPEPTPPPEGEVITEPMARVTLDASSCTYEGDDTPKAPAFYLGIDNRTSRFSHVEIDRLPAGVEVAEVEEFFEEQQALLDQGVALGGPPEEWRLNRRVGLAGPSTGSMLVGDPIFPEQMLVAGERYVVWCSTGDPHAGVFLAGIVEPEN